jgi:hypothetical protein
MQPVDRCWLRARAAGARLIPKLFGWSQSKNHDRTRCSFVEGMQRESPFAFRPRALVGVTRGTYTWLPFSGGCRPCLARASPSRS